MSQMPDHIVLARLVQALDVRELIYLMLVVIDLEVHLLFVVNVQLHIDVVGSSVLHLYPQCWWLCIASILVSVPSRTRLLQLGGLLAELLADLIFYLVFDLVRAIDGVGSHEEGIGESDFGLFGFPCRFQSSRSMLAL